MALTDADYERIVDRAVQRRLSTDSAYLNAENGEQQAAREEEITREVEEALRRSAFAMRIEQARL
jgi:hypothetical protein